MTNRVKDILLQSDHIKKYLAQKPFHNQPAALNAVLNLAKDPGSFDVFSSLFEPLVEKICLCPDPDMALANLDRLAAAVSSRHELFNHLKSNPLLFDLLTRVLGCSQFLSDTLIRNPNYLDWLAEAAILNTAKPKEKFHKELKEALAAYSTRESRINGMRLFQRREMLRIGARDLLGATPLEITVEEISHLADVLFEVALELAWKECTAKYGQPMEELPDDSPGKKGKKEVPARFCVMGMGKLGGLELNYSSDVDIMFVYSGEGLVRKGSRKADAISTHEFFNRLGEQIVQILSSTTKDGAMFRVDTRLRPEGDTGPLTRSMESYETYYATWGEAWEKLALIKTRPIAGDMKLGEEFIAMTRPFVFEKHLGAGAREENRPGKRRIETRLVKEGTTYTEVKLGYGGIREIEFSIQLLQLMHGGQNPALRDANTLRTVGALTKAKLLLRAQKDALVEAYCFLRRVEHCLQIVHEFQVHQLPVETAELEKLARRTGYCDGDVGSALEQFRRDYKKHTDFVHAFHRGIFGEDQQTDAETRENMEFLFQKENAAKAREVLASNGFTDPPKALSILILLANGPSYMHLAPATVREFAQLTPALLALLKESPDPDMALNEFERIVSAQGARGSFYRLLNEHDKLLKLLVVTAGNSPDLSEILARRPEFLEALTKDDYLSSPKPASTLQKDLAEALVGVEEDAQRDRRIKLFKQYEMLRIGVRDLLSLGDLSVILGGLTDLADALFVQSLNTVFKSPSWCGKGAPAFAVMALGKWGSRELGYYSDLDALFVYADGGADAEIYQKMAQNVIGLVSENTENGFLYKMDARLRPGGKNDVLVLPLEGYRQYYETKIQTWERQALTRLRCVAGDKALGERFCRMVEDILYHKGLTSQQVLEIQMMRARMTREKVPVGQKGSHVKLDVGGLVDVEFIVQLVQLHWGWKYPVLRHGTTLEILDRAKELGLISPAQGTVLREGYCFLRSVENKIRMITGLPSEAIPHELDAQYRLVRRLGFKGQDPRETVDTFWKKYRECTGAVRQAFSAICEKAKIPRG